MDRTDSRILMIGLSLVLACALFPPWRLVGWGINGETPVSIDFQAHRAFLLSGPEKGDVDPSVAGRRSTKIDAGRLLAELSILSVVLLQVLCIRAYRRRDQGHR